MSGKENVWEKLTWCWKIWLGGRSGWKMGSELEIGKTNIEDVASASAHTFTHWGVKCGGEEGEAKAAL